MYIAALKNVGAMMRQPARVQVSQKLLRREGQPTELPDVPIVDCAVARQDSESPTKTFHCTVVSAKRSKRRRRGQLTDASSRHHYDPPLAAAERLVDVHDSTDAEDAQKDRTLARGS